MKIARSAMCAALAVLANCWLFVPNNAFAEECIPQRKIVTEIKMIDGVLQTHVHTSGYCSPWEAIADALLVAVKHTDPRYREGVARLKVASEEAKIRTTTGRANELLVAAVTMFRIYRDCPAGVSIPEMCPHQLDHTRFIAPPIAMATKN